MTRECNYSLVDIQPGRPSSTLQKGLNVVNPQPSEDQKINCEPSKMQSHLSIILYFQLKWRLCIAKKRTMLCLIFGWAKFKHQKFPLYLNRRNGYLLFAKLYPHGNRLDTSVIYVYFPSRTIVNKRQEYSFWFDNELFACDCCHYYRCFVTSESKKILKNLFQNLQCYPFTLPFSFMYRSVS